MYLWILNNKLSSLLLIMLSSLLVYSVFQWMNITSLKSLLVTANSKIIEQNQTITDFTKANKDNNATIDSLQKDVSMYVHSISKANSLCNAKITRYKSMLEDCQHGFTLINPIDINSSDCKITISESNSSTISILNSIGQ